MQKKLDNRKSNKYNRISAEIFNAIKPTIRMDNVFSQRILAYRHGIRYYRFPRKERTLPICS